MEIIIPRDDNPQQCIDIDGSILEGGGQIVRTSLTLASILRKKIRISKIREKRTQPGLRAQHTVTCLTMAMISDSVIQGAEINSLQIQFEPRINQDINYCDKDKDIEYYYKCDCKSSGSVGIMIQQLLPYVLFCKKEIQFELLGGTLTKFCPSTFYINDVLRNILYMLGISFSLNVITHGVHMGKVGIVEFKVDKVAQLQPITLQERGELRKIFIRTCFTGNFYYINPRKISQDIKDKLQNRLYTHSFSFSSTQFEQETFIIPHSKYLAYLTLFSQVILHFDYTVISCENFFSNDIESLSLSKFEEVLLDDITSVLLNPYICLDIYTLEHLIIFMSLAAGTSRVNVSKLSLHSLTSIEIIKKFYPDLMVEISSSSSKEGCRFTTLAIQGIGYLVK